MTDVNNIEEKIWTPQQLEKINALREARESDNIKKKDAIETRVRLYKKLDEMYQLQEGDRVTSKFITGKIDHKGKGVVLRSREKNYRIHCDVRFGRYIFVGVPSAYLDHAPKEEIGKTDLEHWQEHFPEYMELRVKYRAMNTRQLLMMYRENLRSGNLGEPHRIELKRELETRGHVPRKSDRSHRGKIERIKWKDFVEKHKG